MECQRKHEKKKLSEKQVINQIEQTYRLVSHLNSFPND